jgi:hypothetical protein
MANLFQGLRGCMRKTPYMREAIWENDHERYIGPLPPHASNVRAQQNLG